MLKILHLTLGKEYQVEFGMITLRWMPHLFQFDREKLYKSCT